MATPVHSTTATTPRLDEGSPLDKPAKNSSWNPRSD